MIQCDFLLFDWIHFNGISLAYFGQEVHVNEAGHVFVSRASFLSANAGRVNVAGDKNGDVVWQFQDRIRMIFFVL